MWLHDGQVEGGADIAGTGFEWGRIAPPRTQMRTRADTAFFGFWWPGKAVAARPSARIGGANRYQTLGCPWSVACDSDPLYPAQKPTGRTTTTGALYVVADGAPKGSN